jgi:Ca-activated chloride channel homolog
MKLNQILAALFLLFLTGAGFAQDKKAEQKPLEVKVNLSVFDASGNPVGDLKQEDLKIYEDGVEQKITYFAKKESAFNLGLVMDNTGSMRVLLEDLVKSGSTVIDNMQADDKAFIVRFVSSDQIELVQNWTSDKARLKRGMDNLYIEGGQSAVLDALYTAVKEQLKAAEKENPNRRTALLLISDVENRASYYALQHVLELLKGTGIQVFSIALTYNLDTGYNPNTKQKNPKKKAEFIANELALATGGAAFVIGKEKDLSKIGDALKAIVAELRSPYVVGYTSTNSKRDDAARKLTVQIADGANGAKRRGVIRESFVVPKE